MRSAAARQRKAATSRMRDFANDHNVVGHVGLSRSQRLQLFDYAEPAKPQRLDFAIPFHALSGKKLWKNKGVGRARMGSMSAAQANERLSDTIKRYYK